MDAEERRSLHLAAQERTIEAARQQFAETGNPLFVWEAYSRCRHDGLQLPEWVLAHFDETTRKLGVLVEKSRSGALSRDHRAETIAAFGMNVEGRGSIFARFAHRWPGNWEWVALGEKVAALRRERVMVKVAISTVARELAARHRVPLETGQFEAPPDGETWMTIEATAPPNEDVVRAAWYRYKATFPSYAEKPPLRPKPPKMC